MWNRALRLLGVGLAVVAAAALIVEGSLRSTGGLSPGAYVLAVARRVAEERVKIARELHDTLAHSLVAINVRAGVAVDLHDSQDPSAALN